MRRRIPAGTAFAVLLWAVAPGAWAQASGAVEAAQTLPALRIGGFADFHFSAVQPSQGPSSSGFNVGQLAFHVGSTLASQVTFFSELTLSARAASGTSPAGFNAAVERLILSYQHSDAFKASFGRYHTPINWWNTAYHHGQWLQTTISRPEMVKFGGKFIPVHFLGGLVEGTVPAGGVNLGYFAGLGNGRSADVHGTGDTGDNNTNRAWLIGYDLRPDALYDLRLGAAYYRDRITLTLPAADFRESIASARLIWASETPEFIAEYAAIGHRDQASGADYDHHAWYAQTAWRLPCCNAQWKPYLRYERLVIDEADPVFSAAPAVLDRRGGLAGLRYDFTDFAALKGEYRRERSGALGYSDALFLQLSLAF